MLSGNSSEYELNTITTMAKVKYYAKEKTMVSTNRPKVLAFASDIVEREPTVSTLCQYLTAR